MRRGSVDLAAGIQSTSCWLVCRASSCLPRIIVSETIPTAFDRLVEPTVNAYDEVLYVGHPFAYTHPDRLATLAIVHGVEAAPVPTCRVLEIGCGDGANIVPMAATFPDAEFVGCDYAARPVARAQQMVADLGLRNIRILQLDLRDIPPDAGSFDYIIVHGLYSWIPLEVRRHLMPVIARHLAPNGVAYVSYNAFPGCRVRQAAWDMLRLHTKDCPDLKSKLATARALIALMVDSGGPVNRGEDTLRAEFRKLARPAGRRVVSRRPQRYEPPGVLSGVRRGRGRQRTHVSGRGRTVHHDCRRLRAACSRGTRTDGPADPGAIPRLHALPAVPQLAAMPRERTSRVQIASRSRCRPARVALAEGARSRCRAARP